MKKFTKTYDANSIQEASAQVLQDLLTISGYDDLGIQYEVIDRTAEGQTAYVRFYNDNDKILDGIETKVVSLSVSDNKVTATAYICGKIGETIIIKPSEDYTVSSWTADNILGYTKIGNLCTYVRVQGDNKSFFVYNNGIILSESVSGFECRPLLNGTSNNFTPETDNDAIVMPYLFPQSDGVSNGDLFMIGSTDSYLMKSGEFLKVSGKSFVSVRFAGSKCYAWDVEKGSFEFEEEEEES